MSKKLHIKTWGCQMNEYDSAKMVDLLTSSLGYETTELPEEADLLVLNTCSIREKAQEKLFHQLGRWKELKKKNPIKKSDLYEAGLCHFQCMKELHPAKTVAHAHGHHHRSAVFSAAPTVVCCRAGHSLLLLLRCKYRKFFRKSSFSAGILFCVKKWAFLLYK
jgi:tRNA A37 methylthiotransferase MiaB